MADQTLYDTTAPSQGSLALAHQKLLRIKRAGVFVNITGDINNLKLGQSQVRQKREAYGAKATDMEDVIAYNFAPSFQVEVVRDPVTKEIVGSQAWLVELYKAAFETGADNKREFQLFADALDERMPVFEGTFNVAVDDQNTGYADKAVLTFSLTSDGPVQQLDASPIASDGKPQLESASPSGQGVGDLVKVTGYRLHDVTGATIDGQTVLEILHIDYNTIALLIPSGVDGEAAIVVTNSAGNSNSLTYAAAEVG